MGSAGTGSDLHHTLRRPPRALKNHGSYRIVLVLHVLPRCAVVHANLEICIILSGRGKLEEGSAGLLLHRDVQLELGHAFDDVLGVLALLRTRISTPRSRDNVELLKSSCDPHPMVRGASDYTAPRRKTMIR